MKHVAIIYVIPKPQKELNVIKKDLKDILQISVCKC